MDNSNTEYNSFGGWLLGLLIITTTTTLAWTIYNFIFSMYNLSKWDPYILEILKVQLAFSILRDIVTIASLIVILVFIMKRSKQALLMVKIGVIGYNGVKILFSLGFTIYAFINGHYEFLYWKYLIEGLIPLVICLCYLYNSRRVKVYYQKPVYDYNLEIL